MTHNEWEIPRFSKAAVALLDQLHEPGWSMRILPLFRRSALDWQTFAAALEVFNERRRVPYFTSTVNRIEGWMPQNAS